MLLVKKHSKLVFTGIACVILCLFRALIASETVCCYFQCGVCFIAICYSFIETGSVTINNLPDRLKEETRLSGADIKRIVISSKKRIRAFVIVSIGIVFLAYILWWEHVVFNDIMTIIALCFSLTNENIADTLSEVYYLYEVKNGNRSVQR